MASAGTAEPRPRPRAALGLCCLLAGAAHPDSLSSSRITIDGARAYVELRCQVVSWLEVLPELDRDGDGAVAPSEVAAAEAEIAAYVARHYQVWTGTDRDFSGGRELAREPRAIELFLDEDMPLAGYRDWIEVRFDCRDREPLRDVQVVCTLFADTSPGHVDVCEVEWIGGAKTTLSTDAGSPRARFDPEGRGAFGVFARLGFEHILSGFDHLAFLAALVFATRGWKALLGVVTAFTLAHSLTLGLSALGALDLGRHASLIEALIALSIAYVASETAIWPRRARSPWVEAFAFGLVHGMGFAGFLAAALAAESAKLTALSAFNLGVEAGQLAVLAAALPVLWLAGRGRSLEGYLAPLALRRIGSAIVALLGFYWFFERL